MGKRMLRGWQRLKVGSEVGSGRQGEWTLRRLEGETRRGQRGAGDGENGNREGETGRRATGRQRGRWRGGQRGGRGKRWGQAHRMPVWNELTGFSDFAYPCKAGYPS